MRSLRERADSRRTNADLRRSMLPAKNRLRGERAFTRLFRQGRRAQGKFSAIVYAPTYFGHPRFGIVAGLAVDKRATARNRVRRQYSEIAQEAIKKGMIRKGMDFAVLVRPQAVGQKSIDLAQDFFLTAEKIEFSLK